MSMPLERFEELCSAYVLGALEGEELLEFKTALASPEPEMKQLYLEMKHTTLHLPLASDRVEPPPRLRETILRNARRSGGRDHKVLSAGPASVLGFNNPRFALGICFALLVAALGLGYYAFLLRNALKERDQQIVAMQNEFSQQQKNFVVLQDELTRKDELLKVLQSPKIDVVIMNGLEVNPSGFGKIIWDPEKRVAILQVSNLPAVPSGKDYQLWVIKDKKPLSAGVFTVNDPNRDTFFKIEQLVEADKKSISAFAITLEPRGGVPKPTGTMYLLGSPVL